MRTTYRIVRVTHTARSWATAGEWKAGFLAGVSVSHDMGLAIRILGSTGEVLEELTGAKT